ncbi:MAG: VTT domain-containing protein [Myxococcales bacterium]
MKTEFRPSSRARWILLVPPLSALLALLSLWWILDLSSFRSLDQVQLQLASLREDPAVEFYVVLGFALLTSLFLPVTLLVVATILTFGSSHGFVLALSGIALAASTTYWAGRAVGSRALFALAGPKLLRVTQALQAHAFWASAAARVAPLGNFTVVNMLAGSMRIPFPLFLLGSSLGAVPGTLLIAVFADRARIWVSGANNFSLGRVAGAAAALLLVGFLVRRLLRARSS